MVKETEIWKLLEEVPDPEIPVISVIDLGIVRSVRFEGEKLIVGVTPTYSGCPAVKAIEKAIADRLHQVGYQNLELITILSPAWTTDWLTKNGREKLEAYGIAPPVAEVDKSVLFSDHPEVPCPQCKSKNTRMLSQFGSTACKSLYQCNECLEPFDYFKCLK